MFENYPFEILIKEFADFETSTSSFVSIAAQNVLRFSIKFSCIESKNFPFKVPVENGKI